MFSTAKNIADYVAFLLPYRKTKWGLFIGLLPLGILWVSYVLPTYKSNIEIFRLGSIGSSILLLLLFIFWLFHSKRVILRKENFTIVLSLKANDAKSNEYIKNAISMVKFELTKLGLLDKFRIFVAGTDIFNSLEKAHKYRENFDIDLLIWGEVISGKKEEKEVCDFKRLFFTYKIPRPIIHSKLTDVFKTDINIALVNRDWNVYEFNSLPDLEKITGHITEVIMFILGIIYSQGKDYAEDSIIILERLFQVLDSKSKNGQVTVSSSPATVTISPTMLRKGRVLAILLNIYKNIGLYFNGKKNFLKAKFYLEKHLNYDKKNIDVLSGLAFASFFLNDYPSAKRFTDEIGKIDNLNQVYLINRAFFGIWEGNYPSSLHFYKEFTKRGRAIDGHIVTGVLSFLNDRKNRNNKEIAYDFAIGLLDYNFINKEEGKKELRRFLKLAKDDTKYKDMVAFIEKEIINKKRKK
jgi:hypothetical protein